MEDDLHDWCRLEYAHIAQIVGANNLHFTKPTSSSRNLLAAAPQLTGCHLHETDVLSLGIPLEQLCLLDPAADQRLEPEDADSFEWFLFGGILGDDPPRGTNAVSASESP
jgi:ribosome biogenesis SPOUT family RNA methylase Rps3